MTGSKRPVQIIILCRVQLEWIDGQVANVERTDANNTLRATGKYGDKTLGVTRKHSGDGRLNIEHRAIVHAQANLGRGWVEIKLEELECA